MKYLILLGDVMVAEGTLGRIDTIPKGLIPRSDVANLSVMGYDLRECYTRSTLEAANMGITLAPEDVAFGCNLVTLADGDPPHMEDFTAGHIFSIEVRQIITDLQEANGSQGQRPS